MKLCKDCKFYLSEENPEYSRCGNDYCVIPAEINLVTGDSTLAKPGYCSVERRGSSGKAYPCGIDGLLWEANP
jgi:hypothetical protein